MNRVFKRPFFLIEYVGGGVYFLVVKEEVIFLSVSEDFHLKRSKSFLFEW